MEQLISNVLEYSSAGFNTEKISEIDLDLILEDVKKILYIPKNTTINILKKLPILKGEKTKFQQLFLNLISNAIKFGNKENNIIEIDVIEKEKFYQFSINDNGIGIDKKFHDRIFKVFHFLNKAEIIPRGSWYQPSIVTFLQIKKWNTFFKQIIVNNCSSFSRSYYYNKNK